MPNLAKKIAIIAISALFLSACNGHSSYKAAGYVEGKYTYIATSVSGDIADFLVSKGEQVKQGQKLVILEEQPESDMYHAAVEKLNESTNARNAIAANLAYAKLTYERYKILVPQKAIQQSQLDNAKAIYDALISQLAQANANIASANATLAQTKWTLEQKTLYAPISGVVFETFYRLGEYTEANRPILSLLAPENIKVVFYVPESVLGGIKLNDVVSVHCDGCATSYNGKVTFISPSAEYTPPVIYSTETNEKLIFRLEATFDPKDAVNLHPGQPATVTYKTHG